MDHLDLQGSGWSADPAVDYPSPLSSEDFSLTDNSSPLRDDVSVDAALPLNEATALGFNDDVFTPLPPIPSAAADPQSSLALNLDASIPPLSPHSIAAPPLPSASRLSTVKSAASHSAYSYSSSSSSGPITFTLPASSSGSLTSFHVSTSSSAAAAASGAAAYGGLGARPLPIAISSRSTPAGYTKPAALLNSVTSVTLVPPVTEPPVLPVVKHKRARTPGRKSDFCKTEQTEEERRESKRQMRLYRNRLSAQQSRERKKQHVHLLEAKLQAVVDENKILEQRVHELTEENEALKRKLASVDYTSDGTTSPLVSLSTDEPLSPPAKRLALSPSAAMRTGATLFAFVFAFSILFSFSGLDVLRLSPAGRSISVAPIEFATTAPRGRVLHEWNAAANPDASSASASASHVAPSALPAPSSPPMLPGPKHSGALQKLASHSHTVAVKVAAPTAPEEVNNHLAVDIYKRDQGDFIREAMEMYKTMLLRSNQSLATTSTSIMFCPSAIHIQPQMFTDKVVISRDFASNGVHSDEEEEREALDPRNLLVWVPSKSLAPDWAASFVNASVKRRPSDVTELKVKISTVRPVHDETN